MLNYIRVVTLISYSEKALWFTRLYLKISPVHILYCSLKRQEFYQLLGSYVHKGIGLEEPLNIKILAIGKGGVGKSTIVNALFGMM